MFQDRNLLWTLLILYMFLFGIGILLVLNGNKSIKNDSWYFALIVAQFYSVYLYFQELV